MLVSRRMGKGRRVLSSRSEEVHDASRITILSGKSEWSFSPTEVSLFPWQFNSCFLSKGQAISTQHGWICFPSKVRLSVVQQGNSTGKNSPWESTVCSSPNSLMRRPLQRQRQPLRTVPDTWLQIIRSQALSQIFPDQHFLGLNQWCEPLHACFTPSTGRSVSTA